MDVNDIRNLVTLFSFIFFLGLMVWASGPARREAYLAAAQLPFDGEVDDAHPGARDE